MQIELNEYEINKFNKGPNSISMGKISHINIEMKEKLSNRNELNEIKELQKIFKFYQKIIRELMKENHEKDQKIENLIKENEMIKETHCKNFFKDSSFLVNQENNSSRDILIKSCDSNLAKKNQNPVFFSKLKMKRADEELEPEKIFLDDPEQTFEKPDEIILTTSQIKLNLKRIPRKSIVLQDQTEFDIDDTLAYFTINFTLENCISSFKIDDFEIGKSKSNQYPKVINIFNFYRYIFIL